MIRYFRKSFVRYLAYGLAIALLSFIFGLFKANAQMIEFDSTARLINNSSSLPYTFTNSANGNYTTRIQVVYDTQDLSQWPYDNPYIIISACTTGEYTPSTYNIVRTYAPNTSCANSCYKQEVKFFMTNQSCPTSSFFGKKLYVILEAQKINVGSGSSRYYDIDDSITFKSDLSYPTSTTIYGIYMSDTDFSSSIQNNTTNEELNNIELSIQAQMNLAHQDSQAAIAAIGGVASAVGDLQTNIDDVKDSIDNVNSSINNDNVSEAESKATDFFNNFSTNTHGLTGIITAPLNAISSITSSTCSPLVLPLPFVDEDLTLPCMRPIYEEFFGDFMTLYDIIVLGIVSYWIVVRIFSLVKDFKNPEHDEVEVMEL